MFETENGIGISVNMLLLFMFIIIFYLPVLQGVSVCLLVTA